MIITPKLSLFDIVPHKYEHFNRHAPFILLSKSIAFLFVLNDLYTGKNTTHLFIDDDSNHIMGFVSLRASAIVNDVDGEYIEGSSALEVSVLAVDEKYERRGIGTALIEYVISIANELHEQYLGLEYIILDADESAVDFYRKMCFIPIEERWSQIPKERWSKSCVPMSLRLDFERNYFESYANDDGDDDE